MMLSRVKFSIVLFALPVVLKFTARRHPAFSARLKERNLVAQIMARDEGIGRWISVRDGGITTGRGMHAKPDVTFVQERHDRRRAVDAADQLAQPDQCAEGFQARGRGAGGSHQLVCANHDDDADRRLENRHRMPDGTMRYCNMANGGPLFVYVKDGKIIRTTPIDFDERSAAVDDRSARPEIHAAAQDDARPAWSVQQVDHLFARPAALPDEARRLRSEWRAQRPESRQVGLRADYLGRGARHRRQRDQARPARSRPRRHGGVARLASYLGQYRLLPQCAIPLPQCRRPHGRASQSRQWEGWYWGAAHHWGYTLRVGQCETYGTVEDLLQNCEMIVFWSADPETTSGSYGAQEGTVRRQWLKKLGIKLVHIDPYYNSSAQFLPGKWICPKPTTSPALAMAIAYVWIKEGLYDKEYVATHTVGFDSWKAYVIGERDGVPKSPEWQEKETGVAAKDVRALAREWAGKRTYLGCGGWGNGHGGACRNQTGIQWARTMVCLIAMQGLGKPGINMGNLQWGSPLDFNFYFPGYADGGMSGDIEKTSMAVELYQRMPQLPTMNTPQQKIPRISLPEAIIEGKADGYPWNGKSIESQFAKFSYPAAGHAPVRMMYKYGGSMIATMTNTNRHVRMFQSPNLEFIVSQSIWFEGDTKFADVILPACTNFERVGHQRMGRARRLWPSRPSAAQPSRHHLPGAGHRAARRVANPTSGSSTRSASVSASPITSPKA